MPQSEAMAFLRESLAKRNVDVEVVEQTLTSQAIEVPSWAFADSGTRFKVFRQKGAARDIFEKLADAARVHEFTGVAPSVAVHVLWDLQDVNVAEVASVAGSLGLRIGAVNPTLFERDEYKFGSLANPDAAIRAKAVDHCLSSIEIMKRLGSRQLSVWLADGTNYPGQDSFVARKSRLTDSLRQVHDALESDMEMLIEYKFFEPAFYSTDIPDWGTAYALAKRCGPKAKVLVDLGHHPKGTNIEQIVALLADEGMLGGFHLNSWKYADDDLTTGSAGLYELFLILNELVSAAGGSALYDCAYMIDQSHNVKPKVQAMVQSVMSIQEICAKALCVDRQRLSEAQAACDIVAAEEMLKQAFFTDVRPLLAEVRGKMGLATDPLLAYRQSGYEKKIQAERS